jgi:hypothetical protein
LYPRPERTSSWNAKKEMARRRNSKRRERERERESKRESKRRRAAAQASKGIQATEPGIDPGTLTLGHVIHDQ